MKKNIHEMNTTRRTKNEKDGICAADFCFRARTGLFNDEFNNECILE